MASTASPSAAGFFRSWTTRCGWSPNTSKETLMRRNLCGGILGFVLLAGAAGTSAAQETGTPIFMAPYRAFENHEFGGSLSDTEGISFALEGFYRYGRGPNDFGLNVGFADVQGGGDA